MSKSIALSPTLEEIHANLPDGASLVSGYPHYCIRRNGEVFGCHVRGSRHGRLRWWHKLKHTMSGGYPKVNIYNENGAWSAHIHKLLMFVFVGPRPDGLEVHHKDDNPQNCHLDNLCYGTKKENQIDAIRNGKYLTGENCHAAKRTDDEIRDVRRLAAEGMPYQEIAERFGMGRNYVCKIVTRKIWKHLQ